jgi:hypothetical protein
MAHGIAPANHTDKGVAHVEDSPGRLGRRVAPSSTGALPGRMMMVET